MQYDGIDINHYIRESRGPKRFVTNFEFTSSHSNSLLSNNILDAKHTSQNKNDRPYHKYKYIIICKLKLSKS